MQCGKPLSNAACDALFQTAALMIKKDRRQMRVVNDDCTGIVTSDFDPVNFVGMDGVEFEAELADENGSHDVRYMVRHNDLDGMEDAEWYRIQNGKVVKNEVHEND
jgi:hypothetical protein